MNIFSIKKKKSRTKLPGSIKWSKDWIWFHRFIMNINGVNECLLGLKNQIYMLSGNINVKTLKGSWEINWPTHVLRGHIYAHLCTINSLGTRSIWPWLPRACSVLYLISLDRPNLSLRPCSLHNANRVISSGGLTWRPGSYIFIGQMKCFAIPMLHVHVPLCMSQVLMALANHPYLK